MSHALYQTHNIEPADEFSFNLPDVLKYQFNTKLHTPKCFLYLVHFGIYS